MNWSVLLVLEGIALGVNYNLSEFVSLREDIPGRGLAGINHNRRKIALSPARMESGRTQTQFRPDEKIARD